MKKCILYILFALICSAAYSQERRHRSPFTKLAANAQFAGSTGFATAGVFAVTRRDKIELGLLYGFVPKSFGGPNHSLSFKFVYNPFQLHLVNRIFFEPIQIGAFFCQNFNDNLGLKWGSEYPHGYYWWNRSLRTHIFAASQVSYKFQRPHIDRLAYYFEANTNDLYIASYIPDRRTVEWYDIFFFGMGLKLYMK